MTKYRFTRISKNKKVGPIPVVTASRDSCPSDCPLMNNGCYAEHGPLRLVWDQVDKVGVEFPELLRLIRQLPRGTIWRYGQAGDLPDDPEQLIELAKANSGKTMICYTHKRDFEAYRHLQSYGVFVNLSATSMEEADSLSETGLPVVVVLPSDMGRAKDESLKDYRDRLGGGLRFETKGRNPVAICPATYLDTDCSRCQACSKPRAMNTIIGFPAHGTKRGIVNSSVRSDVWRRNYSTPLPT